MRDSIKHIRDIDPPCVDDFGHSDTTAASGWVCGRCGQHVAYGETHSCFGIGPDDTAWWNHLPPPSTELSLEDRVAKLETYVADLCKAVEQLIEWIPYGNE